MTERKTSFEEKFKHGVQIILAIYYIIAPLALVSVFEDRIAFVPTNLKLLFYGAWYVPIFIIYLVYFKDKK